MQIPMDEHAIRDLPGRDAWSSERIHFTSEMSTGRTRSAKTGDLLRIMRFKSPAPHLFFQSVRRRFACSGANMTHSKSSKSTYVLSVRTTPLRKLLENKRVFKKSGTQCLIFDLLALFLRGICLAAIRLGKEQGARSHSPALQCLCSPTTG